MNYLETDNQTYADLSITDGLYDEQTLFSLFAKTATKKGQCWKEFINWIFIVLPIR